MTVETLKQQQQQQQVQHTLMTIRRKSKEQKPGLPRAKSLEGQAQLQRLQPSAGI
jgi:hypothetical protein